MFTNIFSSLVKKSYLKSIHFQFLLKIGVFLVAYLLIKGFVPSHTFPMMEMLDQYGFGTSIKFLANHDGAHYLSIARNNYNMYEQAFFPFFPILIKFFEVISNGHSFILTISANIFFALLAIIELEKLTKSLFSTQIAKKTLFWWLAFPTSFFFFVVYNESLFIFFTFSFLNALYSKNLLKAFIMGFLASLTRLVGIFLIFPALYLILKEKNFRFSYLLSLIGPMTGLGSYMVYLWWKLGDPIFFLSAQPSFGANRSTNLIFLPQVIYRYLKIFMTANHDFVYFVAIIEMIALLIGIFCVWKCFQFYKLNRQKDNSLFLLMLIIFGLASIILPTLTGTLSSLPRYLLTTPTTFWGLALLKGRRQYFLILISFIAQFVLFTLFSSGYFIS